ncbi:thiosulfate oxidation carrier complex protein SoxZ [Roseibium polysiphoniae]|uniref:Thiosulfate oxidation carrier complex protein SoxZ n=1 Tax=Roseibium polysiphoniae TaxID=2571221 RepID=A0A927K819_9HYPH|nr:thiosulfate oxidation carrier complex protein SoxZ [Roseibium polysiphoniae]MBD8875593.1 thiosulfate oxidation carrier complex protein SoxZ [Roseibium polysiphoniae]MBS8259837.1 thiosulfate oxidation carrier complex protein SoxZ [Roseibium polysiphoniae]
MAAPKPRVKVPKKASKGEVVTLKTLISHPMESGQRKDKQGNPIPRKIINKFTCEYNGQVVFSCDMDPAVSANPYLEFTAKVEDSGTFKFTWVDDDGSAYTTEKKLAVE